MAELPKTYEPSAIEPRWYAEWMARGYFHADASAPKAPFAIVIPPPNVTGSLHMGHALGDTIEDIFTRWKRRTGDRILGQLKTLGCSLDWERSIFTMDPPYSAAVIEAFVRLHEEGLI